MDILLDDCTEKFNPCKFFNFYTSLLPPEATKEGCKAGFLFQRVKNQCRTFNLHERRKGNFLLLRFVCSVGKDLLGKALPALCEMVGSKSCTNHQIR